MDLLGELGVRLAPQEFLRKTSGKMNHQILREIPAVPMSDADLAVFEARKESLCRRLCRPHLKPIAGLIGFLAESRRLGISMAVATAAGKANREFVLDGLGIAPHFHAVIGAEDVRNGKPHPEIFLKAADRLRVDPAHCVVFEDAIFGIEAAGRAGMKAVALATSLAAGEFQTHPAVVCIARDYTSLQPRALLDAATRPRRMQIVF
jgi:HAD superfamily hydrolase (TIGR01509 family)